MYGPLTEFAVRYASIIYTLFGLLVLAVVIRRMKVNPVTPILCLAFSPLFFLVSHVNFGHAPSFLATSLSLYFWQKTNTSKRYYYAVLSGGFLALSCYGYMGYMIASLILLACIIFSQVAAHKRNYKNYFLIAIYMGVFAIFCLPIAFKMISEPTFSSRFVEKFGKNSSSSRDIVVNTLKNYPKYFGIDELFLKGEQELPGGFVSRHSLKGHGMYLRIYAPILVLAFFAFLFTKDKKKWEFAPYFLLFLLAPLTDVLTTTESRPPYPFALYPSLISIPFITAYALRFGGKIAKAIPEINRKLVGISFVGLFILEIGVVVVHFYRDYPQYSSDYWGWQYGPKEIVRYFKEHQSEYDQLLMTGYFNQPQALLDFYNFDGQCTKCMIGGITRFDPEQRQLFALRTEELSTIISQKYVTKAVINLPNGNPAYSMIEITPE